jgi:ribosomal protein L19
MPYEDKPIVNKKEWLIDGDELALKIVQDFETGDTIRFREDGNEYKVVLEKSEDSSDLYLGTVVEIDKVHDDVIV